MSTTEILEVPISILDRREANVTYLVIFLDISQQTPSYKVPVDSSQS